MKKATLEILDKFPYLKKHVHAHENMLARQQVIHSLENDIDETFIELIWFFQNPEKNDFDLKRLYKTLSGDWLLFALEVIHLFFKDDLYLINGSLDSVIFSDDYVDQAGASRHLISEGFESYTQNKIATYIYRGVFPKPDLIVANKKFWKKTTISNYANHLKI